MLYISAWYGVCFLISGSYVAAMLTSGGSTIGFCNATSLWRYPWQAYVPHGNGPWSAPEMH